MDIDRVNTYASVNTIVGWFLGLAYYNWIPYQPPHLPIWEHVLLIIGGMFAASIIIGGGVALIAAALTRVLTGHTDGDTNYFAWGAFISPVLAFFAAGYVIDALGTKS